MAIVQEIDMAILNKSLKLLHSPDEGSAEQLRAILEETIKNKHGNRKSINLTGLGLSKKSTLSDTVPGGKRKKPGDNTTTSTFYSRPREDSRNSDSGSDDVALKILDDDLSCVVCCEMAVGAGNNLVECLECHSLYHQECHNPPITQDVNDPRFVWYCSSCTKKMSKVSASSSSKGSTSSSSHSTKSAKSSSKNTASSNKKINVFSSSNKSSPSTTSIKHSSMHLIKPSIVQIPKMNITEADKRIQTIKKNATKKHEKKKSSK